MGSTPTGPVKGPLCPASARQGWDHRLHFRRDHFEDVEGIHSAVSMVPSAAVSRGPHPCLLDEGSASPNGSGRNSAATSVDPGADINCRTARRRSLSD
jgi:hypothetical protein